VFVSPADITEVWGYNWKGREVEERTNLPPKISFNHAGFFLKFVYLNQDANKVHTL